MHVIIIGGGITGLATAYYLQQQAAAGVPLRYTLIESAPRLGGKIVTHRRDGFVIEGGPDSFVTQKPWALELCRELGLEDRLIGTNPVPRPVYVLQRGRLVPLPEGVMLVVPTKIRPFLTSPLLSWPGKLRMGLDLFIPPRREDGDESLASFIRRRLGQEALDKIAEPLMAGIHVADAERLSLLATFPRFAELERRHGSLIRGVLATRKAAAANRRLSALTRPWGKTAADDQRQAAERPSGSNGSVFVTLQDGVDELVEALVRRLDRASLLTGCRVIGVRPQAEEARWAVHLGDGTTLTADAVVLAVPAYVAADLIESFNPTLATGLRKIRYVSTATVSLGYRRADVPHPLDSAGFLIPRSEGRRITACTWSSIKFAHRAPADHVLLRAFVGGARDEHLADLDDAAMLAMVRSELRDILGITAVPVLSEIFRWPKGNPQYDVGHLERVARLEALCNPGLFLAGSAYHGVGLPDCVRSGRRVAKRIVRDGEWGVEIRDWRLGID